MGTTIVVALVAVFIIFFIINKNKIGGTQMDPVAALELIAQHKTPVLDVRTPEEYQGGHIKGAQLIPVSELVDRIGELDSLKEKQFIVYCHAGNRSASACNILQKNGFTKAVNLQGGIVAWGNAGNKIVTGK